MRILEAVNGSLFSISDSVEVLQTDSWFVLIFTNFDTTLTFLRHQPPSQPDKWNVQ